MDWDYRMKKELMKSVLNFALNFKWSLYKKWVEISELKNLGFKKIGLKWLQPNFQTGNHWRTSITGIPTIIRGTTPKFGLQLQRFWWVKFGSLVETISGGSYYRWENVVSNLKELYLSISGGEQQIQSAL